MYDKYKDKYDLDYYSLNNLKNTWTKNFYFIKNEDSDEKLKIAATTYVTLRMVHIIIIKEAIQDRYNINDKDDKNEFNRLCNKIVENSNYEKKELLNQNYIEYINYYINYNVESPNIPSISKKIIDIYEDNFKLDYHDKYNRVIIAATIIYFSNKTSPVDKDDTTFRELADIFNLNMKNIIEAYLDIWYFNGYKIKYNYMDDNGIYKYIFDIYNKNDILNIDDLINVICTFQNISDEDKKKYNNKNIAYACYKDAGLNYDNSETTDRIYNKIF